MSEFEQALRDYRAALEAASSTATTDMECRLYRLYAADLVQMEQIYGTAGDAKWCLPLLESGHILHRTNLLAGERVLAMRATFATLLQCARSSQKD